MKKCSEGCLLPGAGASLGIFGQEPQGMVVNAKMALNYEITYSFSHPPRRSQTYFPTHSFL